MRGQRKKKRDQRRRRKEETEKERGGREMAAIGCGRSAGHVLHHFTLQRSCLLQSGAPTRPVRLPLPLLAAVRPLGVLLHGLALQAGVRLGLAVEELRLCGGEKRGGGGGGTDDE